MHHTDLRWGILGHNHPYERRTQCCFRRRRRRANIKTTLGIYAFSDHFLRASQGSRKRTIV